MRACVCAACGPQTKETLTLRASSFGSKCELPGAFLDKVAKSGLVDAITRFATTMQAVANDKELKKSDGSKRQRILGAARPSGPPFSLWQAAGLFAPLHGGAFAVGPAGDACVVCCSRLSAQRGAACARRVGARTAAGIPKLDDANDAGGRNSHNCTLILTEGDSAKALAVSGLSVVGRDQYGVFPLR